MRCFKYFDLDRCTQCCSNFLFGALTSPTSQLDKLIIPCPKCRQASKIELPKECLPSDPPDNAESCFRECNKQSLNEKCKRDEKNKN
jgi:hypothetical protein